MGTQTDLINMKDVAVYTDKELTETRTEFSEQVVSEVRKSRSVENSVHLLSPKPKSLKTLTNHEEQSINDLFKVGNLNCTRLASKFFSACSN